MKVRLTALVIGLAAYGGIGLSPITIPAVQAAETAQPAMSQDVSTAVQNMGKTLSAKEFSVKVQTIRVYLDNDGQPLHVFHSMKVVARRPDRLAVHVTGDDGSINLLDDGKTVAVVWPDKAKYATMPAAKDIESTLDEIADRTGVDFPLADFFSDAPGKAVLSGVTAGKEVGTVTINGVPCRHLFFTQSGGVELELWIDKTEQSLPHRLIVTYRLLPGQPSFIAEFSDWDFAVHPADAEFAFQPPAGATKVDLKAASEGSK